MILDDIGYVKQTAEEAEVLFGLLALGREVAPIDVRKNLTTTVTLSLDVDRWLRPDFRSGASDRLAQWIADADLDHDGVTTVDELQSIQADVLLRPDRGYDEG